MNSGCKFLRSETIIISSDFCFQRTLQAENWILTAPLTVKISLIGYFNSKIKSAWSVIDDNVERMTKVLQACSCCKDLNLGRVENKNVKRVEKKANEN
jgi:hypothetical protein